MYSYSLFEVPGGFGFQIERDGQTVIYQPNDPDLPGDVPMTQERAEEAAQAVIGRMV